MNLKKFKYCTSIIVGSPKSGGVGAFSRIVNGSGVGGHGAVCLKKTRKFKMRLIFNDYIRNSIQYLIIIGGCVGFSNGSCFSLIIIGAGGGGVGGCKYLILTSCL